MSYIFWKKGKVYHYQGIPQLALPHFSGSDNGAQSRGYADDSWCGNARYVVVMTMGLFENQSSREPETAQELTGGLLTSTYSQKLSMITVAP